MEYKHENGYVSLTKENFWNEIKEKCPEALRYFRYNGQTHALDIPATYPFLNFL